MKAGRKEGKNREREERKKEGRKFKKGRKTSLKILPAKTWKKLVSLNSDICGHFRQFPTQLNSLHITIAVSMVRLSIWVTE